MKYKVTMIRQEIWRAETVVDTKSVKGVGDLEDVKDLAWLAFDNNKSKSLEQENFTKVELIQK